VRLETKEVRFFSKDAEIVKLLLSFTIIPLVLDLWFLL